MCSSLIDCRCCRCLARNVSVISSFTASQPSYWPGGMTEAQIALLESRQESNDCIDMQEFRTRMASAPHFGATHLHFVFQQSPAGCTSSQLNPLTPVSYPRHSFPSPSPKLLCAMCEYLQMHIKKWRACMYMCAGNCALFIINYGIYRSNHYFSSHNPSRHRQESDQNSITMCS